MILRVIRPNSLYFDWRFHHPTSGKRQIGLPKAQYAVGYFTEMGIGCRRDPLEANVWYVKAADQGDERAKHRIAAIRAAASGADPTSAASKRRNKGGQQTGSPGEPYSIVLQSSSICFKSFRGFYTNKGNNCVYADDKNGKNKRFMIFWFISFWILNFVALHSKNLLFTAHIPPTYSTSNIFHLVSLCTLVIGEGEKIRYKKKI